MGRRLIDAGRNFLTRVAGVAAGVPSLAYADPATPGATCTLTGTAWEGRTAFRSNTSEGSTLEWGERDYLIPVEALVINGVRTQPVRGGQFTETLNGVVKVFEISTPPTGEKAWRFSDPQETIYRVHTVRVS